MNFLIESSDEQYRTTFGASSPEMLLSGLESSIKKYRLDNRENDLFLKSELMTRLEDKILEVQNEYPNFCDSALAIEARKRIYDDLYQEHRIMPNAGSMFLYRAEPIEGYENAFNMEYLGKVNIPMNESNIPHLWQKAISSLNSCIV